MKSGPHLQWDRKQLFTILSLASLVCASSFKFLCTFKMKFEGFCKRIGDLYHFVQRAGAARKLASSESLTVLSPIMVRLNDKRSKWKCLFSTHKVEEFIWHTYKTNSCRFSTFLCKSELEDPQKYFCLDYGFYGSRDHHSFPKDVIKKEQYDVYDSY